MTDLTNPIVRHILSFVITYQHNQAYNGYPYKPTTQKIERNKHVQMLQSKANVSENF